MRTFLGVKIGLLPMLAFWALLGLTTPLQAVLGGLGLSIVGLAWQWHRGVVRQLETGALLILVALALGMLIAPAVIAPNLAALALAGLGMVCLVSLARGRPWTADYARADQMVFAETPLFHVINTTISAILAALFLILSASRALSAPGIVTSLLLVGGAIFSIVAPKYLVRFGIRRVLTAQRSYNWPAPNFALGDADYDVAIVGAGIGGLTAAALLADAGLSVLVAEQHVVPGGFCHNFLRKAHHQGKPCVYRFDAGPHDFSGVWPGGSINALLWRLGLADRIKWRQVDHTYRLDGTVIDVPRDWQEYASELGRRFPDSTAGLAALFADIHTIFNSMLASGEERGGFPGMPDTEATMLAFSRAHPLAATWLDRPFEELLDRHAIDPAARRIVLALSGYISDGTDILTCGQMVPIFGYYFHGGFYPVGGSQKLADVLLEAIEARGGVVRLRTPVAQILVEDGRAAGVRLADGTQLRTRAVVSNADAQLTFLELLQPGELPDGFRARVAAARPANSAFMVHLGVDFVPDIRPAVHDDADLPIGIETLSLLDPSAAPAGHATIGIFTLLRHDEAQKWFPGQPCEHEPDEAWKSWRQSSEYQARKQALGNRMVAAAEHAIPGLTAHIVHRSDASPVTYARYDRASSGAIYGLSGAPILRGAKSPIPGLVVAGTTMFGPGVEAVLLAGACAAEALVPNLLRRIPLGQSSATGLESCVSTGGINARRGKSVPAWT